MTRLWACVTNRLVWYDLPDKLVALLRMPHVSTAPARHWKYNWKREEEMQELARWWKKAGAGRQPVHIYILSVLVPQSDGHGSLVEQGLCLICLSSLRLSLSLSLLSHLSLLHTSHILNALKVSSLLRRNGNWGRVLCHHPIR